MKENEDLEYSQRISKAIIEDTEQRVIKLEAENKKLKDRIEKDNYMFKQVEESLSDIKTQTRADFLKKIDDIIFCTNEQDGFDCEEWDNNKTFEGWCDNCKLKEQLKKSLGDSTDEHRSATLRESVIQTTVTKK